MMLQAIKRQSPKVSDCVENNRLIFSRGVMVQWGVSELCYLACVKQRSVYQTTIEFILSASMRISVGVTWHC